MSETETSSTLVSVGGWLQIPFSLFMILIFAGFLLLLWPVLADPLFWTAFGWWTTLLFGFLAFAGVLGLGFAIMWLRWRRDIPGNKQKLIWTSIVGIILSGTVPGLLVLVGAAIYPTKK